MSTPSSYKPFFTYTGTPTEQLFRLQITASCINILWQNSAVIISFTAKLFYLLYGKTLTVLDKQTCIMRMT